MNIIMTCGCVKERPLATRYHTILRDENEKLVGLGHAEQQELADERAYRDMKKRELDQLGATK